MKYKTGDRVRLRNNYPEAAFSDWIGKVVTIDTAKGGFYTAVEIKPWFLTEDMIEGYAEDHLENEVENTKKLAADLRELGCPVNYLFWETPEGIEPIFVALVEIQGWLKKEKNVFVGATYHMFSESEEKISYEIKEGGICVYQSRKRWAIGEVREALYDGIKMAVKLLKEEK